MLTPAEELGLSGLRLASRVRKAFYKIPEARLLELMAQIREEAFRRHLIYLRDGELDTIRVLPCPITVLPDQLAYIHFVSLTISSALKRLPELYMQDFGVREALRLSPGEEEWLWQCWGPSQRENNPVFGRLDAMVDFISPMWKDSLRFVEPNMSGIGGLHLVPTCERIVHDVVLPVLEEVDPELRLSLGQDVRELLMQDVLEHLEAVGRPAQHVCFVEPKYAGYGPDEQEELAQYFHAKYGLRITHADPAELTLSKGEVCYGGEPIDLVYRDYSVLDLLEIEREGKDVEPMRTMFRQNRIISSITAELDQKSCWEVLTDPQFTLKYFNPDERQVFRRHILWTRILSDRRVSLPDSQPGDLLPYVRREQESLVLKPNRAYGGDGVVIGPSISAAEWESAIEKALADRERWVVQKLASIPVSEFPVLDEEGKLHVEPFYAVMGFAATKYGLAILGRASQKQVVNVAQRGGMCAVMTGHAGGK
ncbi:MAG: circularly permuted type 2 ATP-grasp protein [Planctomycetes bacterium]|nr:circularly permuted type 2 ATP-grasp protein [Planctomycetota bacterium]